MAITKITKYPKTVVMDGTGHFGTGDYEVRVEDVDDDNTYIHTATLTLGEQELEFPAFAGGFTVNKQIPMSWNNEVPNAESRVGTLTVITKKQTALVFYPQVEVNTVSIVFKVPTSIVPTVTDVAVERIDGAVPSEWGVYVQEYSKCKLTASAQGSYGSTIKTYRFSLDGSSLSSQSSAEYTYQCYKSGTLNFSVTAIDSRGRTSAVKSVSIEVQKYNKPKFNSIKCFRCDAQGNETDEGTYVLAQINYSVSSIDGNNTASCKAYYWETDWTGETLMENNTETVLFGSLNPESSQKIRFLVADVLSDSDYVYEISTAFVTVDFLNGGQGVAFGKVAELSGYFDNAFKTMFRQGFELPDTGWETLTLAADISTAANGTTPQYQHCGDIVKIKGNVTGISAANTTIATLPEGARPTFPVYFVGSSTGNHLCFWSVETDGKIKLLWRFNVSTCKQEYGVDSYVFDITYLI